jgi:four helix bundle protein
MNNKEFGELLEIRTRKFAISIIKLSSSLPDTTESKVIRNQITKSGTSIGANYREANRSRSNRDFTNKIRICESEASETLYWLELILEVHWINKSNLELIVTEAKELLALFTRISKSLKEKKES